jgi:hypothetical protein
MHTCPVPSAVPSLTPFFHLEGQRHDLVFPLREGSPAIDSTTPCPCCQARDPVPFEREANLVIAFSPAEDVGLLAEVACIHCGQMWPIRLDTSEPADLAA